MGELGGVWSAIYKRSVILEHDLWFPEHITYEDNYWSSLLRLYIRNLCIVDKVVYHYYYNPNSTVHSLNSKHHLDRMKIELLLIEEYQKRNVFSLFYQRICVDFLRRFYANTLHMLFTRFHPAPNIYEYMKKMVVELFPDFEQYLDGDNFNQGELVLISMLKQFDSLTDEEFHAIQEVYLQDMNT